MSDSARSPLSGCAILIAAVLMLVFLIGFSVWLPFRQADEIEKFTQEQPAPVPALQISDFETETTSLVERLENFRSSLADQDAEAIIELDAQDLNLAIAQFEPLEELRGTFHVDAVKDDLLHVSICYQLNGRPRLAKEGEDGPITADPRYLVGTLKARPLLTKRELVLSVDALEVPNSEVPEGFMGHFSTLRIFEAAKDHEVIGPAMAQLTSAQIEGDKLVLSRIPGAPIPDVVTDEQFQKSGGKIAIFLGAGVLVFLIFAGLVLFIGYRTQLRKIQEQEKTNFGEEDA
ncbi:hypothetical protein [Haloferula rosea]|uniref:Uncharacterized protein n=1 Tax=Haloferula rosea TaxID=490093 RepID=A0A934RAN7_9BACT|nr:hypothetical protein [Haloferula rosea]MBK1827527.1 hypothetical protein [Haloferula rosea]